METLDIAPKKRRILLHTKRPTAIPESLVYERLDGQPIYYQGYRDVMAGRKTIEEIIGSSTL